MNQNPVSFFHSVQNGQGQDIPQIIPIDEHFNLGNLKTMVNTALRNRSNFHGDVKQDSHTATFRALIKSAAGDSNFRIPTFGFYDGSSYHEQSHKKKIEGQWTSFIENPERDHYFELQFLTALIVEFIVENNKIDIDDLSWVLTTIANSSSNLCYIPRKLHTAKNNFFTRKGKMTVELDKYLQICRQRFRHLILTEFTVTQGLSWRDQYMRRRFLWVLWFSPFCSTEDFQLPETFIWWQGEKPVADEEEEIDFGNERDAEESDISFSWFLQQEHGEAVNQSLGFLTSEIKAKRGSEANNEKLRQKYFGGEGKALLQHLYSPTQGNILITGSEAGSLVKEVLTPEQHFYLHGSTNIDLHIAHGMQRDFSD